MRTLGAVPVDVQVLAADGLVLACVRGGARLREFKAASVSNCRVARSCDVPSAKRGPFPLMRLGALPDREIASRSCGQP